MGKEPEILVKSGVKAIEYYPFKIEGIEYIRPISMKYHDNYKIEGIEEKKKSDAIREYGKLSELFFEDLNLFENNPTQYGCSSTTDMLHNQMAIYNDFLEERNNNDFVKSDINNKTNLYNKKLAKAYNNMGIKGVPSDELYYDDKFVVDIIWNLLEIGSLLKTKSTTAIAKFDEWVENKEKEEIRNLVVMFANEHGLLNILSEVFFGLRDYDCFSDVDYIIDKIRVSTFANKLSLGYLKLYLVLFQESHPTQPIKEAEIKRPFIFRDKGKKVSQFIHDVEESGLIKGHMPLLDYIKTFFPTYTFMYHVDDYIQMDNRYWTQYSEPIYLFLLAAKYFFDEFSFIREERFGSKVNLDKLVMPINGKAEVSYTRQQPEYIFTLSSTFDAVRYKAIGEIMKKSQNIMVCPACGKLEEEASQVKVFCSEVHRKRIESQNLRDNAIKQEEEECRRLEEMERQADLEDTDF